MNFLQNLNLETIILLIAALGLVITLIRWHMKEGAFDASQIITNPDGTFSLSKFGQLVSMLTSTWVIIYQTRTGALAEWLFTGYMLTWAGANAFTKYLESKKQ
jgi:high-affinity Fe2+/Pb2+ permease